MEHGECICDFSKWNIGDLVYGTICEDSIVNFIYVDS